MELTINSTKGRYNICDPSEEYIQTYICVSSEGKSIKRISIKTEKEYSNDDFWGYDDFNAVLIVCDLIDEWKKRTLFSSKEKDVKDFKDFIESKKNELNIGTLRYMQKQVKEKQIQLSQKYAEMDLMLEEMKESVTRR